MLIASIIAFCSVITAISVNQQRNIIQHNVGLWMDPNMLKMNSKKTDVIYIGSRNQLNKCESKEIHVRNNLITRSLVIKYLGAWIDELLTFQHHINMKCKTAI